MLSILQTPTVAVIDVLSHLEPFFSHGQDITFTSYPYVERWQQKDAHDEGCNEPTDDNNRKRPLRIRTDGVRKRGGQES